MTVPFFVSARGYLISPLKPKDLKKRRTAPLTSRCCILFNKYTYWIF